MSFSEFQNIARGDDLVVYMPISGGKNASRMELYAFKMLHK